MPHYVYIVLVRTNTFLSRTISIFTKGRYTHASISLNSDLSEMYSFGRKFALFPFWGVFLKENINKGLFAYCDTLPGAIIRLSVTKEQHDKTKEIIDFFCSQPYNYSYNYTGLVASVFNMRTFNKNEFLCSEFVYHVLYESGIADFKKHRNLVKPMDFLDLKGKVIFEGDLKKRVSSYYMPNVFVRVMNALRVFHTH